MTDLPLTDSVPSRLGTSLRLDDGRLVGRLTPPAPLCERGTVPVFALVFVADVVAGMTVDTDPDLWTFTSDVTVRAPLAPTPVAVDSTCTVLREGRRSSTCEVPFSVDGAGWGSCFIGFSRVARREGDPPKPPFDLESIPKGTMRPPLEQPIREAAGFTSDDPSSGRVVVELRPDLLNPAGALQGAMVAALAEVAAEDLADHHHALGAERHVVTELDLRFLAQNRTSPIAAHAWFVGRPSDGVVRVDLVDDGGRGRVTTAALLRVRPAPQPG